MSNLWQTILVTMRIKTDYEDADVIIIPEQHLWHKNITSIPTMVDDNKKIIDNLYSIISNSRNPVVILDGDIFHRGTPRLSDALPLIDYLHTLNSLCDGRVYSVVGNHEFTYHKDNIFWIFADVKSEYVENRIGKPKVLTSYLTATDELQIGSVLYCLGHYDMDFYDEIDTNSIDDVILITHSCFGNQELFDNLKVKDPHLNTDVMKVNNIDRLGALPLTNKLKYIYVGHLHTCIGTFRVQERYNSHDYDCILTYLGSLGRTSHAEYTDFNERKIPIHKIRNGKLIEVVNEIIELPSREHAVDDINVALSKEKYEEQKIVHELRSVKLQNVDLISNVREVLSGVSTPGMSDNGLLKLFDSALIGSVPDEIVEVLRRDYNENY